MKTTAGLNDSPMTALLPAPFVDIFLHVTNEGSLTNDHGKRCESRYALEEGNRLA